MSMFINYDNPNKMVLVKPCFNNVRTAVKPVITKGGKFLGVQADYGTPFTLYFHLENFSADSLEMLLISSTTLEILSFSGKSLVVKNYATQDIFNQFTRDLHVEVLPEDIKDLKKETYKIKLTLNAEDKVYPLFSEKDGYLTFR